MSLASTRAHAGGEARYFCYLLTSCDPKFKNHTYVGFTVNPKRRLRQHNGELTNGAKRTTRKRPWEMVVTIYGFPTKKLALRFEWILQHPRESKIFRDIASQLKKIGNLWFLRAKLRFMLEMLHIAPFQTLPLTVHWLTEKYKDLLVDCPALPPHIRSTVGSMEGLASEDCVDTDEDKELDSGSDTSDKEMDFGGGVTLILNDANSTVVRCYVCQSDIDKTMDSVARCVHTGCNMTSHLTCLSNDFLADRPANLLPTSGVCRGCNQLLHWGDVIRKMKAVQKRQAKDRSPLQPIDTNISTNAKSIKAKKDKKVKRKKETHTDMEVDEEGERKGEKAKEKGKEKDKTKVTTTKKITKKITNQIITDPPSTSLPSTRLTSSNFSTYPSPTLPSFSSSSFSSSSTTTTTTTTSITTTNTNKYRNKIKGIGEIDELYSSDERESIKFDARDSSKNNISPKKQKNNSSSNNTNNKKKNATSTQMLIDDDIICIS